MNQTEPDFWVLEYVTITKDPRTELVVAIGGTEKAADILHARNYAARAPATPAPAPPPSFTRPPASRRR